MLTMDLPEDVIMSDTGKTPRQILNIWKDIMENNNAYSTDFGTCYGRNYPASELRQ